LRTHIAQLAQAEDPILISSKWDMLVEYWGWEPHMVPEDECFQELDIGEHMWVDDVGVALEISCGGSVYPYQLDYPFTGAQYRAFPTSALEQSEQVRALQDYVDACWTAHEEHARVEYHMAARHDPLEQAARHVPEGFVPPGFLARVRRYLAARGVLPPPPWDRADELLWLAVRMGMPLRRTDDRRLRLALLEAVRSLDRLPEWDPWPEREERHRVAARRVQRRRALARVATSRRAAARRAAPSRCHRRGRRPASALSGKHRIPGLRRRVRPLGDPCGDHHGVLCITRGNSGHHAASSHV
jgi:hypothetical protein